jgi:hypothetical protein
MLWITIFAIQFLLSVGSAAFAFTTGTRAERLAALWWGGNYIGSTVFVLAGWLTPTFQLVMDGICATGFLPFAILCVSWWAGAMTLLAAGIFSLEAFYLLRDMPVDTPYAVVNNGVVIAEALVFVAMGLVNLRTRRKGRRTQPAIMPMATPLAS